MSLFRSDPVVVPRSDSSATIQWRTIRAAERIPFGNRAIYTNGGLGYLFDGAEISANRIVGITEGSEVLAGQLFRYMPPGGIIDPAVITMLGSLWVNESGLLVSYSGVTTGKFSRRVAIGIPERAISVSFGEVVKKE